MAHPHEELLRNAYAALAHRDVAGYLETISNRRTGADTLSRLDWRLSIWDDTSRACFCDAPLVRYLLQR